MTLPRALFAAAAVAVVLFLAFGRRATPHDSAEQRTSSTPLTRGAAEATLDSALNPATEREPARSEARAELTVAPAEAENAPAPAATGVRMDGIVVDDHSLPVSDADVRLFVPGHAAVATRSASDGKFTLENAPLADPPGLHGTLHALAPDGRAAVQLTRLRIPDASVDWPAIEVVVGPARPTVIVSVENEGRPVEGAEVELEVGFLRPTAGVARTDAEGRARFDGVPPGSLHARASAGEAAKRRTGAVSAPSDHPAGEPLRIALDAARDVTVQVRETGSGAPLAGLQVHAERSVMPPTTFMRSTDPWAPRERIVAGASATTDENGRALLRGLPREPLTLTVRTAPSADYTGPPRKRLGADDTEALIEVIDVARRPRVRWPIVAGERPVPPSGSLVQVDLEPGRGLRGSTGWPRGGIMEGPDLVVEDLPGENLGLLATTADGAIARLFVESAKDVGREASFRRARSITVRVRDAAGAALSGQYASARNQGNNQLCKPVSTDADGVAVLRGLYGGLADVWVSAESNQYGGERAGSVDLEQGDGTLEFTAPEALRARLRILVDGAPRLPPGLTVNGARVTAKEPAGALVAVSFTLGVDDDARDAWVNAPGLVGGKLALTRALAAANAAPLDVPLARAGALLVRVQRAADTRVRVVAERLESDGTWANALHMEIQYPNADDGCFRFDPLLAGRYRARDAESGATTEPVELDPARGDAHATLDLTRHGVARGVVVVPEGFDLDAARVVIEGADTAPTDAGWNLAPGVPRNSVRVGQGGAFSLPVGVDRPVTLRAWHPLLSPAAEGGSLRLDGPREGFTLRLVEGPTCEWTMPAGHTGGRNDALRVLLYHDAARSSFAGEHSAALKDGRARFGGFTPGTYTLWIDPATGFAPLTLPDIALGEARTDLGAPPFVVGSSLRIHLRTQAGASAPRIHVSAFPEEHGPDARTQYNRQLNSRGETEVVLAGLGAGTFRVRGGVVSTPDHAWTRTVTLDGVHDEVIEVDL